MTIASVALLGVGLAHCGGDDGSGDPGGFVASPGQQPSTGTTTVDYGLRPTPDGFGFQNYGNQVNGADVINLTRPTMEQLFGTAVCSGRDTDGVCILTPTAYRWAEENWAGMQGGHCYGMSVLAARFHDGLARPGDFGASTTNALQLAGNVPLQAEIGKWFVTQSFNEVVQQRSVLSANEAVTFLETQLGNRTDSYTLGFYFIDAVGQRRGGHAVTPYGVTDEGGGQKRIWIYDNNFPNVQRYIEVDTNTNSWQYSTAANPAEPADTYVGNLGNGNHLEFYPTKAHTLPAQWPYGYDAQGVTIGQVLFDTETDMVLTNPEGKRVGFVDGKLLNEIDKATLHFPVSAGLWADTPEPIINVPVDQILTARFAGSQVKSTHASRVALIGQGYAMGARDMVLVEGSDDELVFSEKGTAVTYTTTKNVSPTVFVDHETQNEDYRFEVKTTGGAGGQAIDMWLEPKESQMGIAIIGDPGALSFEINVTRTGADVEETFNAQGNLTNEVDVWYFLYGNWAGDGTPMTILIDEGGDGTIDEEFQLDDIQ